MAKGLDEGYPFSDTTSIDIILRESKQMISAEMKIVGGKNASRIWGFLSKFIMVDRFGKTLGLADIQPNVVLERKVCGAKYLNTSAFRVSNSIKVSRLFSFHFQLIKELNPPTKLTRKFLKTWGGRQRNRTLYSEITDTPSSANQLDSVGVALHLSKRLVASAKLRSILNIETGLEMVALAVIICSEVGDIYILLTIFIRIAMSKNNGVFPEAAVEVKNILERLGFFP